MDHVTSGMTSKHWLILLTLRLLNKKKNRWHPFLSSHNDQSVVEINFIVQECKTSHASVIFCVVRQKDWSDTDVVSFILNLVCDLKPFLDWCHPRKSFVAHPDSCKDPWLRSDRCKHTVHWVHGPNTDEEIPPNPFWHEEFLWWGLSTSPLVEESLRK